MSDVSPTSQSPSPPMPQANDARRQSDAARRELAAFSEEFRQSAEAILAALSNSQKVVSKTSVPAEQPKTEPVQSPPQELPSVSVKLDPVEKTTGAESSNEDRLSALKARLTQQLASTDEFQLPPRDEEPNDSSDREDKFA